MRINPFVALRPTPELSGAVASVPYDTVDTAEARVLSDGNPMSFLRVVRPEIDLCDDVDIHSAEVYARGAENLKQFERDGVLVREDDACLYVYRLQMGKHTQRGLVACCNTQDYDDAIILRHEKTRKDKEDDRTALLETVNANTGPVFLTFRDREQIECILEEAEQRDPLFDLTAVDGVRHTVWRVTDCEELVGLFKEVPTCYIADGHHRAAAAARVGRERRAAGVTGVDDEANWFLSVLFPASQLGIMPYNRCVRGLNGLSVDELLALVQQQFRVSPAESEAPASPGEVTMYLAGKWYCLQWDEPLDQGPVSKLDVAFLQDRLLGPILGVEDPRTDARIEFVGGIRGPEELIRRVDSGRADVAFSMHPVTVEQMMDIADAGLIMPPKSTWFEPKLRSGLLVHTL
jgi:uncharacterized protein (DUF1015 family)